MRRLLRQVVGGLRTLRPKIPVLFVTGHAADPHALDLLGSMPHKPFGPAELLVALRGLLDVPATAGPR